MTKVPYEVQAAVGINTSVSQVPEGMSPSAQLRRFFQLLPFTVLCLESWLKVPITLDRKSKQWVRWPSPWEGSLISSKIKYSSLCANKSCQEQTTFIILHETIQLRS
jgi:hypothetical protein